MTAGQGALTFAGLLLIATMTVHSVIGQHRLIRPLLDRRDGVMQVPLARFILPFAWHLTSGIGLVVAAILLAWAWMPSEAKTIGLASAGMIFTSSGLIDAVGSRGRHIGWGPLTLIGLAAFAALFLG